MKVMPLLSNGLPKLSTMDIADLHTTETCRELSESSSLESLNQNKCDIKGFLRRSAFVLLTTAAIFIGKSLYGPLSVIWIDLSDTVRPLIF